MNVSSRLMPPLMAGKNFPKFRGDVKVKLHNPTTGKTEVYESHNTATNALAHIFAGNHGGLVNYNNFADLYKTWLGGILVFGSALDDTDPNDYGIPAYTSNPVRAHAGQQIFTSQNDDLSRGNPNDAEVDIGSNYTKLVWEWGTSAATSGAINSLGLTHSDVGSYGVCGNNGVQTAAQKLLNPFADVACLSKTINYDDNADAVLAINGNTAYNVYFEDNTTVNVYATPINATKFNLQGGSLTPLTDYTSKITATLPNSYALNGKGGFYYHFDFANGNLVLFGVPTEGGSTLYKDVIDLSDGTVTHSELTVTGARLWKFRIPNDYNSASWNLKVPVKAMILNNVLFLYGYGTGANDAWHPNKMYSIDLSTPANINEIDTTTFSTFTAANRNKISERFNILGGVIAHDSFIVNGDKAFECANNGLAGTNTPAKVYENPYSISSSVYGLNSDTNVNMVSVSKLYLATKFNLDSPINKTSAQSMTIEYTLTQV